MRNKKRVRIFTMLMCMVLFYGGCGNSVISRTEATDATEQPALTRTEDWKYQGERH